MSQGKPSTESAEALAIICGGGSLPFAVADAALRRGRRVVLIALRGWADPQRVAAYPHYWSWMGQFGRFLRVAAKEGCRDVVFIGSVARPSPWQMRLDLRALRLMPRILRLFRGGDDHLQSGVGRIFEEHGFRLLGPHEVAPELLMPSGALGARVPDAGDWNDVARGLALLRATSAFDIGQAVVVANNHVLAVEGPEGTDQMLARVAELRRSRRIQSPAGTGVLVKAPKIGQHPRIDLPSIGPKTVEGAVGAGLAGIAVVAGTTIVAEAERIAAAADRAKIFVVGINSDGTPQ
jgi:UDP-2,3-diacylglucosamine hydrolase